MTPFQEDLFEEFGALGCVDSTHKTNEYGYKLIILVVADEYRNGNYIAKNITADVHNIIMYFRTYAGLPGAWGITDTEDVNTYTEFFGAIKKRVSLMC